MIKPGKYDLIIYQGATFDQTFTWNDASGSPVNLSGYTGKLQIRDKLGGTLLLQASTTPGVGDGTITLGGAAGTIQIVWTDEQTQALTFKRGVYDLLLENAGDNATRLLEGQASVSPNVTA